MLPACPAARTSALREYVPLKQGLRPHRRSGSYEPLHLREYVPLKQGLRLDLFVVICYCISLREYVPLKQGLRPRTISLYNSLKLLLREYVPLKQGLRLAVFGLSFITADLREYVPLKQGLRLFSHLTITLMLCAPRVCSTKTRIKTALLVGGCLVGGTSESMFH